MVTVNFYSLDDVFRKPGRGDVDKGARDFKLFAQPGVKRLQGNVYVARRLGREGVFVPVPAQELVFGGHPGNIVATECGRTDSWDTYLKSSQQDDR